MLMQSYNILSIEHVAVWNTPSYSQCRSAPVSSKQESGIAGPRRVCCINTKVGLI